MIEDIITCGAKGYHFGNKIDMLQIMDKMPKDVPVMGNIDPSGEFANGTETSIYKATSNLLEACRSYPNFVISSGCDIPPRTSWNNIRSFFRAVKDYYANVNAA